MTKFLSLSAKVSSTHALYFYSSSVLKVGANPIHWFHNPLIGNHPNLKATGLKMPLLSLKRGLTNQGQVEGKPAGVLFPRKRIDSSLVIAIS